ncbi:MAG: porin, partial [Bacteroidia bacterium]
SFTNKGDYFSADLAREEKGKLAIAGSYCFNNNTSRSVGQLGNFVYELDSSGDATSVYSLNNLSTLFIDAMYKYNGLSIMTEYANRSLSEKAKGFTSGSGYVGQVGYLFNNNIEVSGRYTSVDIANTSNVTEYTLGLSKYIVGHKLKVQSDIAYIDSESATVADYRIRFQIELGI